MTMTQSILNQAAFVAVAILALVGSATRADADDAQRELAQQLANPLASLVSVPLQYNADRRIGPHRAEREVLNVQPVVPIGLGTRWKLISRTVVPLVSQEDLAGGGGRQQGLGDVTQSLFFTPRAAVAGGWLLGVGPVLQLPTGSDAVGSSGAWSVGPTVVAVKQSGSWTYGGLANHLWSVAGHANPGRGDVTSTFVQPFLGYVTSTHTTIALNAEATYDWTQSRWAMPVHLTLSQMLKVGKQPLSVAVAARYWAASPAGGPRGWGLRTAVTLLFREAAR